MKDLRITPSARGWRVENADNGELLGWVQARGLTWSAIDEDGEEVGTGFHNRRDAAYHLTGVHACRFVAKVLS